MLPVGLLKIAKGIGIVSSGRGEKSDNKPHNKNKKNRSKAELTKKKMIKISRKKNR